MFYFYIRKNKIIILVLKTNITNLQQIKSVKFKINLANLKAYLKFKNKLQLFSFKLKIKHN